MGGEVFVTPSTLSFTITVNISVLLGMKIAFTLVANQSWKHFGFGVSAATPKIDSHSTEVLYHSCMVHFFLSAWPTCWL